MKTIHVSNPEIDALPDDQKENVTEKIRYHLPLYRQHQRMQGDQHEVAFPYAPSRAHNHATSPIWANTAARCSRTAIRPTMTTLPVVTLSCMRGTGDTSGAAL
ncbi:MAG: hypothetical protein ABGX04_08940 [Myxococcales bacterium]